MSECRRRYIDLLKKGLTCTLYQELDGNIYEPRSVLRKLCASLAVPSDVRMVRPIPLSDREKGLDWPSLALTMVGSKRLDNIQHAVETVLHDDVPGDLIETGAWRGGASILMRGLLAAHGVTDRCVWVADSFEGLPEPDAARYAADTGDRHHTRNPLAVSLEQVKENFERLDLLDDQVRFLKGWFKDTLPGAPLDRLAVVRLDGDMYESTMDGLVHLYPKLSPGGFLIVDDYGVLACCRKAVHDYREEHGISEEIHDIDQSGVFWRRDR